MAVVRSGLTADDLLHMSRDPSHRYELVKGELVQMPPVGGEHADVAAEVTARLRPHAQRHRLGTVLVEAGFRLASDPDTVRAPDVSFIAATRVPAGGLPKGYITGVPDLAVEVMSPDDTASDVEVKVQEYLEHGTRLVLVVHPRTCTVTAYRPDGTARVFRGDDILDLGDVVAGFTVPVRELFSAV